MDKNKIIEAATKFVQKGQYDKAIKEYQKVLEEDSKDVRILQKLGELHQKKNENSQAASYFLKVAESYSADGFFLKAVAVYKQVLKLDPSLVSVVLKLADLYQQLGLMSDAMAQFQTVSAHYEKAGDVKSSLDILRKMVGLDPDNVASRIKLAELYAREQMNKEAVAEFGRAAEYLKKNNRADDYLRVAERLSTLDTSDLGLTRELANLYLGKGDTKRALAKLQLCFKADPKDIETLNLLAKAFQDLGQVSKTVSVYKELAKIYTEMGKGPKANEVWRKVLDLAPDDTEAQQAVGAGSPVTSPPPSAPSRPQRSPAAAPTASGKDAVAKLLTETDVYVKYGLHDKAIEHLRKVFAVAPDNIDAHEKAVELYAAQGNQEGMVDALAAVVRLAIAQGETERARPQLEKLLEQAPGHREIPSFVAALGGVAPRSGVHEVAEDAILGETSEEVPVADAPEEVLPPVRVEPDLEVELEPEPEAEEDLALAAAAQADDSEVVEEEAVDEPLAVPRPKVKVPPGAAPALRAAAKPKPAPKPVAKPAPKPAPRAAPKPAPKPAEEAGSEELEEAAFFLEQGQLEEAREIVETVLLAYPSSAAAKDLLRRIEAAGASAPEAPAALGDGDAFDLAAELAEELGDSPAPAASQEDFQVSVEEVLEEFKKGVEKQVKKEDSQTHFDLGLAYKEMGLADEAMSEFQVALEGSVGKKKEIDCYTMLGLCHAGRGEHQEAIESFKLGLRSDYITPDASKAINFELGICHEAMGELKEALRCFARVNRVDEGFREVKDIVGRLSEQVPGGLAALEETGAAATAKKAGNGSGGSTKKGPEPGVAGPSEKGTPGKTRKIGYV